MATTNNQKLAAAKKTTVTAKSATKSAEVHPKKQRPKTIALIKGGSADIPHWDAQANNMPRANKPIQLLQFKHVFSAGRPERLDLIKRGIRAKAVTELASLMHTTQDHVIATLGLPRATINRKIQQQQDLSMEQAERVVGLAKLVGQVEQMMAESGAEKDFDAPNWVNNWIEMSNPALGNRRPAEYMDTVEGQEIVASLLAHMQSGAYA